MLFLKYYYVLQYCNSYVIHIRPVLEYMAGVYSETGVMNEE